MRNVEEALIEGAVLTVLVVFLFLNSWRSTVITGLALPVSVLASFIAVWVFGFTLNTMSLLGLSLAIGILIDDAIVVRENIVRHVEMGKDHYTAAREGTDEIGLAVAATTFSIVAVFVPIGFMPGIGGQWFKPFALTIACSVLVSLFVSFSLDPMLSAYWPDPHVPEDKKGWITRAARPVQHWFNRQANGYKRVIAWALDHRAAMVALALGTFFASFALPGRGIARAASSRWSASAIVVVGAHHASARRSSSASRSALAGVAAFVMLPAVSCPCSATVGVGFFPVDDQSRVHDHARDAARLEPRVHAAKAEEAGVARARRTRRCSTRTPRSAAASPAPSTTATIYVRLVPKDERKLSARRSWRRCIRAEVDERWRA